MIIDGIEYTGICNKASSELLYFNQLTLNYEFYLKDKKVDIKSIISVGTSVNININQVINTPIRISAEGKSLKGKKIMSEVNIKHEIKYLGQGPSSYIYIDNINFLKFVGIVMPQRIDDRPLEELIRKNKMFIEAYIEDVYVKLIDKNRVNIDCLLLFNTVIKKI